MANIEQSIYITKYSQSEEFHQRLVANRSFSQQQRSGHPIAIRTPELEEAVLEAIQNNLQASTRNIGCDLQ